MGRRTLVGIVVFTACLVLAGGCSDSSGVDVDAVIQVGSTSITRASVEHWMSVIAASAEGGGQPAPETPDPPRYRRCIAYKRAYDPKPPAARPAPNVSQLKSECERDYEKVKLKALYFLISLAWLKGKGAELGVHADAAAVQGELAAFKKGFPSEQAYKRYDMLKRITQADTEARLRMAVLVAKIQQKLEARAGGTTTNASRRTAVMREFANIFRRQWKAKTSCRAGYVVPLCKEYKPPAKPSALVPPQVPLAEEVR
jgi:hypothetical protein